MCNLELLVADLSQNAVMIGFLSFGRGASASDQLPQSLIRFPIFLAEARDVAAEIGAVELRVRVDCAREKALAQRTEGNEADAEFAERGQHFRFRLSPPEQVFTLERGDRLDGVRAADGLHPGFRKPEVLYLACLDQLLHRRGHVFDGHVGIHPMLIEQINHVGLEPLERRFDDLFDVRRPVVKLLKSAMKQIVSAAGGSRLEQSRFHGAEGGRNGSDCHGLRRIAASLVRRP